MTGVISLGLAGSLGPERIARLAPAVEAAGFATLWINETPGSDAIAAAGAAAAVTERLVVATGVVPVDRRPAGDIVTAVAARAVPLGRFVAGIGSGAARSGVVDLVGSAVRELHDAGISHVAVGALGPRMRQLAAQVAEGVVLNWLTPQAAEEQSAALHDANPATRVTLYVRTAVDRAAFARLRDEAARYGSYPNYAANFARLGIAALDSAIEGEDALHRSIPAYAAAVDEVVLRAITVGDEDADYLAFIDRTAPAAN